MRQLTCVAPNVVAWTEVDEPHLEGTGDALIRPVAVARCEIDRALIHNGPAVCKSFALGHEAVAEIVALGAPVDGLRVGQLVVPAFQISCGTCHRCSRGHSGLCTRYPVLSDFGMQPLSGIEFGGMVSDLVRVPHAAAMLHPLPDGVDPVDAASLADNVADGYRAVAPHLAAEPGSPVLVVAHGSPSIALYAAQAAIALGSPDVAVASHHDEVLHKAEAIGARSIRTDFNGRDGRFPIVVDCGEKVKGLHYAIAATEPEGVCQSVSLYAADPDVELPMVAMYTRGIRLQIGRLHSTAVIPELLDLVASGVLRPQVVTTRTIDWDHAADSYLDPTIKLVVARPDLLRASSEPSADRGRP